MNVPSRSFFIHQVDVYLNQTEAVDATGSLTNPSNAIRTGVTALVMDKGGSRHPSFLKEQETKHVRVLFPDYLVLREGNVLVYTTPAGIVRKFQVDSFRDDQDMGRLWVAECLEVPDPTEGQ